MVKLEYVDTREYIADVFTKPLPKEAFEHLRQKLGVISLQLIYIKRHYVRGGHVDREKCQKDTFVINVKGG